MEENKKLPIARVLSFAKEIHPSVTLRVYDTEIKPFLAELRTSLSNGKLLSQSTINIKVKSINNTKFIVPSSLEVDKQALQKINSEINNLFLPSDLVRILTGLARIFKTGDGKLIYNPNKILDQYVHESNDLHWVKSWGQTQVSQSLKDKNIVVETKFEVPNSSKVAALFQAVLEAEKEFNKLNEPLDTTEFDIKTDAENKLIEDLLPKVLEKYEDYKNKVKPKISSDTKFSEASNKIKEKILELIKKERNDFFRPLYSGENISAFRKKGIFDHNRNAYLVTTRRTDNKPGIIQLVSSPDTQYKDFYEQAIKDFLNTNEADLTTEFISPLFVEQAAEGDEETTTAPDTDEDADGDEEIIEEVVFDNPVDEETFRKKLLENVTKTLIENFEQFSHDYSTTFVDLKDQLRSNYLDEVKKELLKKVQEEIINKFDIEDNDLKELIQNNLFADEKYNPEILESSWYKELLEQSITFIENFPSPDTSYDNYFAYLFETHIQPFLTELTKDEEETDTQDETRDDDDDDDLTTGVVPPAIPTTPPAQQVSVQTDQINRLTPEEVRTLQYESTWMYNRAVYELFTSKGINVGDVDQQVLNDLQSNVFNYVSGMNDGDFNKLFGSASHRQKALIGFYQKSGYGINKFVDANELLNVALKNSFNIDSPVLTENIKNTVDSLIVQYGLNQDFYAFDQDSQSVTKFSGENKHDILWFIDNVPPDRLALIFNIPPGVFGNNDDLLNHLRETLKNYAKYRGSELSLHVQNTTLQNGLVVISDEDAEKIKNGDQETIAKHLSFTSGIRDMAKAHGGDTVAGAMDNKKNGDKQKIQKQFKTFLPLWSQLDGWEQAEVYKQFNLALPPKYLTGGKIDIQKLSGVQLEFISEFIFFDVTKLGEIKEIVQRNNFNAQQQAELFEIINIQNQLKREEELARVLNQEFDRYSDPSELVEIVEYVGVDIDSISFRERFQTDEIIQEGGSTQYSSTEVGRGRGGLIPRFLDSKTGKKLKKRFGKGLKSKISAKEKGKKAFNKATGAALSKVAAASLNVIPGIGTALSAALLAIKNKKLREFISGLIVGGLTLLIGRTIWALGSIGGAIGGIIGGVIGGVASGGAMIIPGVIAGANIGQLIVPARWTSWNFLRGGGSAGATYIRDVSTVSSSSAASSKITSVSKLLASYEGIAVLSVGGVALTGIILTLLIVLTIQSAFIIPIPQDRSSGGIGGGSVGPLGPGGFECFVFAGPGEEVSTEYGDQFTSIAWSANEKELVYEAYARKAGRNSCFNSLVCGSGDIEIYRLEGRAYGGWAPSQEPIAGKAIFLYDLPFMDRNGNRYSSVNGLEYTFIHELGHIINYKKVGDLGNKFMQIWDKAANSCLTYPYPSACSVDEAFAESIALFVNYEFYNYHTIEGVSQGTDESLPGSDKRIKVHYEFPQEAPKEYEWVKENIFCNEEVEQQEESYIAIGPLTQSNIVASTDQEIQNPQLTCSWASGKGLDAAINANYFNTDENNNFSPVGIAGYCPAGTSCTLPVRYYQDATSSDFNQYLKALGFNNNGSVQIINGIPSMQNASTGLSMAVTGSFSNVQVSADTNNKRTIIGTGTANSSCSPKYSGQPTLFMGVFTNSTYANAEQKLRDCGATNLIHLDGGGSSNFCSGEGSYRQNRYIPVNMGMKNAEVIIGNESSE